jgi:hypothetical protein
MQVLGHSLNLDQEEDADVELETQNEEEVRCQNVRSLTWAQLKESLEWRNHSVLSLNLDSGD